jgi:hypothetical protein
VVLPKGVDLSEAKQKITYDSSVEIGEGENIIGTVSYTYGGKTVGATDIIYDSSDAASHLDEASRKIVDTEIQQINKNNKKHAIILQKLSGIKYSLYNMISFFKERVILIVVAVLVVALIILLIARYRMVSRSRRRRRRSKRGSQSGGISLNRRSPISFGKRKGKRRRGTDYTSSRPMTAGKRRESGNGISARKMKKNRKKTKESFGKSFYDF